MPFSCRLPSCRIFSSPRSSRRIRPSRRICAEECSQRDTPGRIYLWDAEVNSISTCFACLSRPENAEHITARDIQAIPSKYFMVPPTALRAAFPLGFYELLSSDQVNSCNMGHFNEVTMPYIEPRQVALITTFQMSLFSEHTLRAFSTRHIAALSGELLSTLNFAQVASFNQEALTALPDAVKVNFGWRACETDAIQALVEGRICANVCYFTAFTRVQASAEQCFNCLLAHAATALADVAMVFPKVPNEYFVMLPSPQRSSWAFPAALVPLLTTHQVSYCNQHFFTPATLPLLTTAAIAAVKPNIWPRIPIEALGCLSADQVAAVDPYSMLLWTLPQCASLPTDAMGALSRAQRSMIGSGTADHLSILSLFDGTPLKDVLLAISKDKRKLLIKQLAGECTICLDAIRNGRPVTVTSPCAHVFHIGCIHRSLVIDKKCPACRQPVNAAMPRPILSEDVMNENVMNEYVLSEDVLSEDMLNNDMVNNDMPGRDMLGGNIMDGADPERRHYASSETPIVLDDDRGEPS